MGSYAEHLVELATLYFNALNANPSKPDLAAFKESMEEVPLHNRPFYTSFLQDMIQEINLLCCNHPEASVTEFKDDKQKCKECGYVRYRHFIKNEDGNMMNTGHWETGRWKPQPITKQVGSL